MRIWVRNAASLRRTDGIPAASQQDFNPEAELAVISRDVVIKPCLYPLRCALHDWPRRPESTDSSEMQEQDRIRLEFTTYNSTDCEASFLNSANLRR